MNGVDVPWVSARTYRPDNFKLPKRMVAAGLGAGKVEGHYGAVLGLSPCGIGTLSIF